MSCEDNLGDFKSVFGTGSASFSWGFRMTFTSGGAFYKAYLMAWNNLQSNINNIKQTICQNLCPEECECVIDVDTDAFNPIIEEILGDKLLKARSWATYTPRTTFLGFGWGGTWSIKIPGKVYAKCISKSEKSSESN